MTCLTSKSLVVGSSGAVISGAKAVVSIFALWYHSKTVWLDISAQKLRSKIGYATQLVASLVSLEAVVGSSRARLHVA
jgi:hypothetical protein